MANESKANITHKNVIGFMNWDNYVICFNDKIYNDFESVVSLEKYYEKF